jgi:hypothetical protein
MLVLHQVRKLVVLGLATLAWATAAEAGGIPFNIADPTSRPVQIWADADPDPADYHVDMVPFVAGTWTSDGTTGVVRVDSATMAALTMASTGTIPISVSDWTISIDLASREVTRLEFYGQLIDSEFGDAQVVQFAYAMQSTPGPWTLHSGLVIPGAVGGFQDVPDNPLSPLFASDLYKPNGPGSDYTAVLTQPYDPATGFITAVGPLYTDWTDFGQVVVFDKTFGDLQLTELPEPASLVLMAMGLVLVPVVRAAMTSPPGGTP